MKSICAALTAVAMMAPASALAEEPGVEETIEYILKRCQNTVSYQDISGTTRIELSIGSDGSVVSTSRSNNAGRRHSNRVQFNIKQVEFWRRDDQPDIIRANCGDAYCLTEKTTYIESEDNENWHEVEGLGSEERKTGESSFATCRPGDTSLKAFKHLQKLLGGAKIVRDPFAD